MPSVMQRVGTPNAQHNLDNKYRKQLGHVDPALSQHNEIIRQRSLEDLYAEHLQPAFDEFNEKQKRRDRRLDVKYGCSTYLGYQRALDAQARASKNAIDQKGRPPIREIVWQFGNPEQGFGCKNQTSERREFAKGLLLEVQAEAERRYPNLVWGDVVFHADEVSADAEGVDHGSFHLHADFIPLCFQNKRGPGVQVAFERCLEEMGFKTFQEWKHDLDAIMETVLQRHGLERTFMENDNEHQSSTEFHRQQKVLAQSKAYEKERAAARSEVKQLRAEVDNLKAQAEAGRSTVSGLIDRTRSTRQEYLSVYSKLQKVEGELQERRETVEELDEEVLVRQSMIDGYEAEIDELRDAGREVEEELDNQRQELHNASQELKTAKGEVEGLQAKKTALTADVSALRAQKAELAEEVAVLQAAQEREHSTGAQMYGAEWQRHIAAARTVAEKDKKIKALEAKVSLYERFIQSVPNLWQRFQEWATNLARARGLGKKKDVKEHD